MFRLTDFHNVHIYFSFDRALQYTMLSGVNGVIFDYGNICVKDLS